MAREMFHEEVITLQGQQLAEAFFWSDLELDRQHVLVCGDQGESLTQRIFTQAQSLAVDCRITVVLERQNERLHLTQSQLSQMEWVVAPYHHLAPIPNSSVDLVVIGQGLGRGPARMLRILRELHRVLRPGGRLVIRQEQAAREIIWWQRHDRLVRMTQHLAGETMELPVELDELLLGLELVGFQSIRSGDFAGNPVNMQQWSQTVETISRRGASFNHSRWRLAVGEELKELHELFSSQVIEGNPFYIVHAKKISEAS